MWNVLAVDDSATSLALLERMIVRLGHRPLLADCGTRALAVCAVERPDVMLLDVVMPDIDGWELAARLRAQDRLRAVPIVFQSSLEAPEDIARCMACGAVDILPKPFRLARLAAIFESLGAPPGQALPAGSCAVSRWHPAHGAQAAPDITLRLPVPEGRFAHRAVNILST